MGQVRGWQITRKFLTPELEVQKWEMSVCTYILSVFFHTFTFAVVASRSDRTQFTSILIFFFFQSCENGTNDERQGNSGGVYGESMLHQSRLGH